MKTDRELLELAARAAGHVVNAKWQAERDALFDPVTASLWIDLVSTAWNPLTNDGDALRLAVKLRISLIHEQEYMGGPVLETIEAITQPTKNTADGSRHCETVSLNALTDDEMVNTRRAIVRAAAAIGEAME
jgi:hypothetical protein